MRASRGVTLIELVIAIVLIGIATIGITTSLFPLSRQSAELVLSARAAELGHAVMDEILSRKFDHNSGELGGLPVCISEARTLETGELSCTAPGALQAEGETERGQYNDVDDFNGLRGAVGDVLGDDLAAQYPNYAVSIDVYYDANLDGTADDTKGDRKRIDVEVTDPQGNQYDFTVYRGNF